MDDDRDELVEFDGAGGARAIGITASSRMRARDGTFRVLPAPAHLVYMRRAGSGEGFDQRRCLLSGEIHAPGAICDIVTFVGHAGWSAELVVIDRASSRSVFFDQGNVVGAQSTVENERLGQVLYRYGVLDETQLALCADATSEAMRFGEVAVGRGFLTRERLFELLGKQSEEIFFGALLVAGGMFYVLESFEEAQLSSRQNSSVTMLVREGVRRMHETRYFRARIPSDEHVPVRTSERGGSAGDAADVYAAIDGVRSVAEVGRAVARSEFDVSRALFQLLQAGLVLIKPPRPRPEASVGAYNRAIALILRELDAMDEGDEIRALLAAWLEARAPLAVMLDGAGPSDDGTFDGKRVAANAAGAADRVASEDALARGLYDFASYAVFLARPQMRRADQARSRGEPLTGRTRLSQRVVELLAPIAPIAPASERGKPSG
jgi:hypothetical protein